MRDSIRKMSFTALFIAIGVVTAHLIYIPLGIAKCFPVQHAINVLLAVFLGTRYGVSAAFCISSLRIALGTGSLLAYPGSLIGAALSGWAYARTGSILWAALGEVVGTGILGGLISWPIAAYVLGTRVGALYFVLPFLVSTAGGSLAAVFLYHTPLTAFVRSRLSGKNQRLR